MNKKIDLIYLDDEDCDKNKTNLHNDDLISKKINSIMVICRNDLTLEDTPNTGIIKMNSIAQMSPLSIQAFILFQCVHRLEQLTSLTQNVIQLCGLSNKSKLMLCHYKNPLLYDKKL